MRNPYTARLLEIAQGYIEKLQQVAIGCRVELGGSLRSGTAIEGHQDIDLKILVPEGQDDETGIRAISALIEHIIAYTQPRPFGDKGGSRPYAALHRMAIHDPIAGEVQIEILVCPARLYVGYAKYQAQLPQWILDAYVKAKWEAWQSGDVQAYNTVKREFYALTRALYRGDYFKED